MKKFITAVMDRKQPISKVLLLVSFVAGYVVSTLLFTAFGSSIHRLIASVFY
jgi:hypothetical protein